MESKYLILDSRGDPIVHCVADLHPGQETCVLTVDDGDMAKLLEHEYVKLVGSSQKSSGMEGRIQRTHGNQVVVHVLHPLEQDVLQNLRMPVHFGSFLYPISGQRKGRRVVVSQDLSCGGIAFYCDELLGTGEVAQIVIPVSAQPLLLEIEILHQRPSPAKTPLYAAKFIELTRDEESMVREAIFSIQIQTAN